MDEHEFSPEEIVKAMNLCQSDSNWNGKLCEQCPYIKFLNCSKRMLADAVRLLNKTFGGGDTDGD